MSLSLPKSVLKQYLNPIFVETGTHLGDGVQLALSLGFKKIHSIEKNATYFDQASQRFNFDQLHWNYGKVNLYLGDSAKVLDEILPVIIWEPVNITFWLDAHLDPKEKDNKKQLPLIEELKIIKKYCKTRDPKLTPDILIDDYNQFGGAVHTRDYLRKIWSQVNSVEVIDRIMEINPNYKVYVQDNKFNKDSILVASMKPKVVTKSIAEWLLGF